MAIRINDSASYYTGRASVTISSFSPGLAGTYTAPGATTFEGSINRAISPFSVSFKETRWPVGWPNVSIGYPISNVVGVLGQDWTAHRDMIVYQGRPLTTNGNWQTIIADAIDALNSSYGTVCKYCHYTAHNYAKDDPNSHKYISWDLMGDLGMRDNWALHNADGDVLWGTADHVDSIMCNTSDVCPDYGDGVSELLNYQEAFTDRLFDLFTYGTDMSRVVEGVYWDGTDPANAFPQARYIPGNTLVSDGTGSGGTDYDGVPDYDFDGSVNDNSQAEYRRGHADAVAYVRQSSLSTFTVPRRAFVATNGGRDPAHFKEGTEDLQNYEWYQAFDHRFNENVDVSMGEFSGGDFNFAYNDAYDRAVGQIRGGKICALFCRPIQDNELGRPYGSLHMEVGGFVGCAIGDYSQAERDWASFWYSLCMLDEELAYCGQTSRQWMSPPPDEWFSNIGNPLRTRSLYTLNNDSSGSMRAADDTTDGNWFFEEFENGYFYINFPDIPTSGITYGSLATPTYSTTAYPATPSGKVARRMNGTGYTNALTGLTSYAYNTSRNDGSLAYTGGALVDGAWRGGVILWADS